MDFTQLAMPILIVSTEDDRFGTAQTARDIAAQLPQARLVIHPDGGHLWLGRDEAVADEVQRYIAEAKARYAGRIPGLELHCADIAGDSTPNVAAVELVYCALVFEYVDVAKALKNIRALCLPTGLLATVLQLPKEGAESVSPSRFVKLRQLGSILRLVPPDDLREIAEGLGFRLLSQKLITLESGKQFSLQLFNKPGSAE